MGKRKPSESLTVNAAARFLGIQPSDMQTYIDAGRIISTDGRISGLLLENIRERQEKYISLRDYLKGHDGGLFDSRLVRNREKYTDFLEEHGYFGIQTIDPETLILKASEKEGWFIAKEDISFLDYKSQDFFADFGLSEQEKTDRILSGASGHSHTKDCVAGYLNFIHDERNIYTPSLTDFARIVFELPDIIYVTDEDILNAMESAGTRKTKELLTGFFTYAASRKNVSYHSVELKKAECNPPAAYPYADFVKLARVLFNDTYDREHRLTERALENSSCAEAWMFLACHYVCGWRSTDICSRWVYPNLKEGSNPFGINTGTLKEDILAGRISDTVYENVALYVIRRIEMSYNVPGKTGKGKLRSAIVPDLRVFFGRLTLIAEYHHLRSGEGYMRPYRAAGYRNWVTCREFFGEDFYAVTGKHAISSRRLNKSYLQGMEQAARADGNTTLVSHVIASYARSHANVDTTVAYLKDHGLTGESAEVVLFMMMQRGVFGVSLYHALLAAFPDAFGKLTAKEQSRLMAQVPLSAYELETAGSVFAASEEMAAELACGKTELPRVVLRAMLAIGQGQGKAKDDGVYCKRKALGLCCDHPLYESCLANLCPHYVFTGEGVPALARVIRDYAEKAQRTGDKKYEAALRKYIIPAFQDVLNDVIREMSSAEKASTRKLLEEVLHE